MSERDKTRNRLTISRRVFEKSVSYLGRLAEHQYATPEYEALLVAAIVFYAGPFSSNEKDSHANAQPRIDSLVLAGLTREQLALHERLVLLRNKALCHAEWTQYPTQVDSNNIIASKPFAIWDDFQGQQEVQQVLELVRAVLHNTHIESARMHRAAP